MAVARLFRSWALRLPSKPRKPASLVACKSRRIAICFICPYLSDTMSSPDRGALSAKEDGPMARLILTSLVLAIFIHPLYAQSSLYTDRSGYTTGTQDGRSVNSYTDRYGNTTGWVGGKSQNTYSDGYGGTTGTLGNKRITPTMTATATLRAQSAEIESISTRTVPASLQARSANGG
jgi:hypothetical protein